MGLARIGAVLAAALMSLVFVQNAGAEAEPVLKAATELVTPCEQRPSEAVLAPVLRKIAEDDRSRPGRHEVVDDDMYRLRECIRDLKLRRGDYASLFRMVRVRSTDVTTLYFVRPALKPYCDVLYGAHLFRYFLVADLPQDGRDRYRLVFANGGDFFSVEPHVSHDLNDIMTGGCDAANCWVAHWTFNGASYVSKRCFREPAGENTRVRVRCSDWEEIGARPSRH